MALGLTAATRGLRGVHGACPIQAVALQSARRAFTEGVDSLAVKLRDGAQPYLCKQTAQPIPQVALALDKGVRQSEHPRREEQPHAKQLARQRRVRAQSTPARNSGAALAGRQPRAAPLPPAASAFGQQRLSRRKGPEPPCAGNSGMHRCPAGQACARMQEHAVRVHRCTSLAWRWCVQALTCVGCQCAGSSGY